MKWYRLYKESSDSDFIIDDGVLQDYNGAGGKVVVPNGVETIGFYCFHNRKDITSVVLPKSVNVIDEGAFLGCDNLKQISVKGKTLDEAKKMFEFEKGNYDSTVDDISIVKAIPRTFLVRFMYSHRDDDEMEFSANSPEEAQKKFEVWAADYQNSEDFDFEFLDAKEVE